MHCQEAFELMSVALDGDVDSAPDNLPDGPTRLRQHLAGCAHCRGQQVALGLIDQRLRGLRQSLPPAPPSLRGKVAQHCAHAHQNAAHGCPHELAKIPTAPARMPAPRVGQRGRTAWGMAFTGAAAALFAIVALGTGRPGGMPGLRAAPSGLTQTGAHQDACQVAIAGGSPVALACASSGRAGARQVMERLTELGRSRGLDLRCTSCHLDERGFQLLDGARDRFASLLAATRT